MRSSGQTITDKLVSVRNVNPSEDVLTGDDGGGNDKTTNAETSNDEERPHDVQVINSADRHGANTGSHEAARDDKKNSVCALEVRQQSKLDHRTSHDTETDRQSSETNLDGVVTVDVV